jgi:hypothetical protein
MVGDAKPTLRNCVGRIPYILASASMSRRVFSLNDVGEGLLHDQAHGVQMWCVLQVLTGKLYET